MLFKPFARAEIKDSGGEEGDRCDGEYGVVHESENRVSVLRKASAGDKDFVRRAEGEVMKQ
jgi:hypothetical protein